MKCLHALSHGNIMLLPGAPPSIVDAPKNRKYITGATAQVSCTVAGEPRPDVHWIFSKFLDMLNIATR